MAGILSYGAYIPLRRLGPETQRWNAAGEKSVANWATGDGMPGNIGSAMDLAFRAYHLIVVMTHTTKNNRTRINNRTGPETDGTI